MFAIVFALVGVGMGGAAWYYLRDGADTQAPPGEAPPGEAPPGSVAGMQWCIRRVERGLEIAAEKGPRRALNDYDRRFFVDSLGLPGSQSLQQGLRGAAGTQGGFINRLIGAIAGSGNATAEQIECRRTLKERLEAIYGPADSWARGGGRGRGRGRAERHEGSGPEFAGWEDMNRAERSAATLAYARRRMEEQGLSPRAQTGMVAEPARPTFVWRNGRWERNLP